MCKYTKVAKVYKFILTTATTYGIIIYRKRNNLLSKQKKPTGAAALPEKDEGKIMEKKFALVTEYGEIDEDRNVKAVRNGTMSIYEAFNIENGTRNGSFDEQLFDSLDDAKNALADLKTIAIVKKKVSYFKFLDCEVSYIEERDYDEDGEYDLAECGDVWATAEEEIKD